MGRVIILCAVDLNKSYGISIIILLSLLLIVPISAVTTSSNTSLILLQQNIDASSLDWGGYVIVSDYSNPQPVIVNVTGSWIIPRVNISQNDTFSAMWIGIGGYLDRTLIQTGTEQDYAGGQEIYSAWFEVLPQYSRTISRLNVAPGDKISASIYLINPVISEWSIKIADVTTGQMYQTNIRYPSSMLSAEWIVERPTVKNSLTSLADFGAATFTDANAVVGNLAGTINSFPFTRIVMIDSMNTTLVAISDLVSSGSSFTVNYLHNMPTITSTTTLTTTMTSTVPGPTVTSTSTKITTTSTTTTFTTPSTTTSTATLITTTTYTTTLTSPSQVATMGLILLIAIIGIVVIVVLLMTRRKQT